MDPNTLQYVGRARVAEFHRDADQRRLASGPKRRRGRLLRLRTSVGHWLIHLGERLVPKRPVGSARIGHQLP